ncbi:hypothetical protein J4Q44_G00390820, partial [Coregonus suidteri]
MKPSLSLSSLISACPLLWGIRGFNSPPRSPLKQHSHPSSFQLVVLVTKILPPLSFQLVVLVTKILPLLLPTGGPSDQDAAPPTPS